MYLDYFKKESLNAFVLIFSLYLEYAFNDLGWWSNCHVFTYQVSKFMTSCNCNIQIFLKNFTEVGLKYFILGPFFYEILFIGCCMIYVFIGITNFKELTKIFTGYKILLLGVQSSGIFMEIYLLL